MRRLLAVLLLALACLPSLTPAAQTCVKCHPNHTRGFSPLHPFASGDCGICHAGDPQATEKDAAHAGLFAFPGNLSNARRSCGRCHPERVEQVLSGLMHSGRGMVATTRRVLGDTHPDSAPGDLSHLDRSPADSLLRKLCAGCHLGKDKTEHRLDPIRDRGGGCLACHINSHPERAHPALSTRISDHRCLGCHSRSGRISLNYVGLAEMDAAAEGREDPASLGRLRDGRLVQHAAADIHQRAGLGCIDCHTAAGLMNARPDEAGPPPAYREQAVDIACRDCHDNRGPQVGADALGRFRARVPFPVGPGQGFLVTQRFGSPLWNLRVPANDRNGRLVLYAKNGSGSWEVPAYRPADRPLAVEHRRLRCDACHSQWAPQCYGCHLSFEPDGSQWDHLEGRPTPGRWRQRAWDFRHRPPTLGVDARGRIAPFIPGMILTLEHPAWDAPKRLRRFAAIAPHTVGKSRSCASCHRDPLALGLGSGWLERSASGWTLHSTTALLEDGLPLDAWTRPDAAHPGQGTRAEERSLDRNEIQRVLEAPIPTR